MKAPSKTKNAILALISSKPLTSTDVAARFKISRQAAAKHLRELAAKGLLVKTGHTRNSLYSLPNKRGGKLLSTTNLIKNIKGLEEDKVYKEVDIKLKLNRLRSNTGSILFYAFTEMLNNAIDHSKSKKVQIHFSNQSPLVFFIIKDSGIGIFKNIMDKFKLSSEIEALEHVSKGKQTTMPSKHSGEGIFFTSKIADIFKIKSHKLEIIFDNLKNDVFYSEVKNIKGTEVYFQLNPNSKKQLQDLFKKYSNDDFIFDKSKVSVKISQIENPLSRSQAKRLLVGLDKFDRVKFDFKGITLIGQAFADEVFRVFQSRHPHIVLEFENAQPIVQKMIHRAISRTDLK